MTAGRSVGGSEPPQTSATGSQGCADGSGPVPVGDGGRSVETVGLSVPGMDCAS